MKRILKKAFHSRFFKNSPRGLDLAHNLARFLPNWQCGVIFDVGANVGQSAREFSNRFDYSEIHCFEPFPATFEELRRNASIIPRIHLHPYALSTVQAHVKVHTGSCSTNNSISPAVTMDGVDTAQVEIETRTLTDVFQNLKM